jgi:predicted nuclease with TOPRIM domain
MTANNNQKQEGESMAKLYEIVAELQEFLELNEGLEDEQAYKDTLESLQGELDDKVAQWGRCIRNIEAERDAIKEEASRLTSRAQSLDKRVTHMKETLLMYMKAAGVTEAGDTIIKAKIRTASTAPLIVDIPPEEVPEEYRKTIIEVDKPAIKDAIKHGKEFTWAHMGERSEFIKIG